MLLATDVPPDVRGRTGVPSVEVGGKVREVRSGLIKGSAPRGMLEGGLSVQGQDTGIGHACHSHPDTEEGNLGAS
eukprot:10039647-Alexandrium_andersonii.AAC.1